MNKEYGLSHLIGHLYRAERYSKLYSLVEDRDWYRRKKKHDLSLKSYADDVDLAGEAARNIGLQGLPRLIMYTLLSASLRSLAANLPLDAYQAMVLLGNGGLALQFSGLSATAFHQVDTYAAIAESAFKRGEEELARKAIEEVFPVVSRIESPAGVDEDLFPSIGLRSVVEAVARARRPRAAKPVLDAIQVQTQRAMAIEAIVESIVETEGLEQARAWAETIKDSFGQVIGLISTSGAVAGDCGPAESAQLLAQAEALVSRTLEGDERDLANWYLAKVLMRAGDSARAHQVTDRIQDVTTRLYALSSIASELAQSGQTERGLALAQSIPDDSERSAALGTIAEAVAQADPKRALGIAQGITGDLDRGCALQATAAAFAKRGRIDEAMAIGDEFSDPEDKARCMAAVAEALVKRQDIERAVAIARETPAGQGRAQALASVALALAQTEAKESLAREILNEALADTVGVLEPIPELALKEIAQALAETGATAEALAIGETLTNDISQCVVYRAVAESTARAGHSLQALRRAGSIAHPVLGTYAQKAVIGQVAKTSGPLLALGLAAALPHGLAKVWALAEIAKELAERGIYRQAVLAAELALIRARQIDAGMDRDWAFRLVAAALVYGGQIGRAWTVAKRIKAPSERALGLAAMSRAFAAKGNTEIASELCGTALDLVQEIPDVDQRYESLVAVATAVARSGDVERALALAAGIEDESGVESYRALENIARVCAEGGDAARALSIVEGIEDTHEKWHALGAVLEELADHDCGRTLALLTGLLIDGQTYGRGEIFYRIGCVYRTVARLGGREFAVRTWARIQAVDDLLLG